ncbi:hypothetical protein HN51_036190 [Arachis hypogaea]|uniref:Auxin-induced protein n=2 Tax=Arachis hypogaea TaxID=3818 RepID=A0A445A164_ARAHY|nr:auxin-responsive protein SAUR72 [Arachis ipaensis]XP_025644614.1 auxin-responsive protein SAUR76 [Arachis hypogaea]QHO01499.1 Auxin-responsive protein [Arachis hypogaea]RYR20135.1 hypothetical protein Ahy_B03g065217 isoform B [Arachis hypogaea]
MAKGGGKLMKLKSVLKKWNSFGNITTTTNKQSRCGATVSAVANDEQSSVSEADFRPVYVGKTWRRYLVRPDVVEHPLFRELVDRSRESYDDNNFVVVEEDTVHVACEVVLFEHLLWMLENADPQPESLDELVDFYTC